MRSTPCFWHRIGVIALVLSWLGPSVALAHRHSRHHHSEADEHHKPACPRTSACDIHFPGDDTGCRPTKEPLQQCEKGVARAVSTLVNDVTDCHIQQALDAFKAGTGGGEASVNEEDCEQVAKRRFDRRIIKVRAEGGCLPNMVGEVNKLRDLLLADMDGPQSLDALNGAIFCTDAGSAGGAILSSSASGSLIDPDGDDAGFIPTNATALNCSSAVAEHLGHFAKDVIRCHIEAADAFEDGDQFDEQACKADAVAEFHGQIKTAGCPACLNADAQTALATALLQFLDQHNDLIYPCPAGTPGSTTTTTLIPRSTTTTTARTTTTSSSTVRTTTTSSSTVRTTTTSSSTLRTTSTSSTSSTVSTSSSTSTSTSTSTRTSTSSTTSTTMPASPSGAFLDSVL